MLPLFGLIAGVGWLLDLGIFSALVATGLDVFVSNAIGATAGVSFAYFSSARKLFYDHREFIFHKFIAYGIYNALSILLFSYLIDLLAAYAFPAWPVVAKIIATPFSFYMNFVFLSFIFSGKVRFV